MRPRMEDTVSDWIAEQRHLNEIWMKAIEVPKQLNETNFSGSVAGATGL